MFNEQDALKIIKTPIGWTNREDSLWSPMSKSGVYSVKTGYHVIKTKTQDPIMSPSSSEPIPGSVWNYIWNANLPQKVKIFLWKACNNILPVCSNLKRRKIARVEVCPLCHRETETVEHALLLCDWTKPVWFGSQYQRVPSRDHITTFHQWFEKEIGLVKGNSENSECCYCLGVLALDDLEMQEQSPL